jgi:hypothetical protein
MLTARAFAHLGLPDIPRPAAAQLDLLASDTPTPVRGNAEDAS